MLSQFRVPPTIRWSDWDSHDIQLRRHGQGYRIITGQQREITLRCPGLSALIGKEQMRMTWTPEARELPAEHAQELRALGAALLALPGLPLIERAGSWRRAETERQRQTATLMSRQEMIDIGLEHNWTTINLHFVTQSMPSTNNHSLHQALAAHQHWLTPDLETALGVLCANPRYRDRVHPRWSEEQPLFFESMLRRILEHPELKRRPLSQAVIGDLATLMIGVENQYEQSTRELPPLIIDATPADSPWNRDLRVHYREHSALLHDADGQLLVELLTKSDLNGIISLAREIGRQHPDLRRAMSEHGEQEDWAEAWAQRWWQSDNLWCALNPLLSALPESLQQPERCAPAHRTWTSLKRHLLPEAPPIGPASELGRRLSALMEDGQMTQRYQAARAAGLGPDHALELARRSTGTVVEPYNAASWELCRVALRAGERLDEALQLAYDTTELHKVVREARELITAQARRSVFGSGVQLMRGARLARERGRTLASLHDELIELSQAIPGKKRPKIKRAKPRGQASLDFEFEFDWEGDVVPARGRAVPVGELARIGQEMDNCLSGYVGRVKKGTSQIAELYILDEATPERLVLELQRGQLRQVSGYRNSTPSARGMHATNEYIQSMHSKRLRTNASSSVPSERASPPVSAAGAA